MKIGYNLEFKYPLAFPASVHAALRDLKRDLTLCLTEPFDGTSASFELNPNLGPEGFRIISEAGALSVEGGDALGLIYGIYAVSEELLGIPPLWYWMDFERVKRSCIEVKDGWAFSGGSPVFKFRGWFINDEDLLSHWAADPISGISYDAYQFVFEALLRSRGNMIVPATSVFADEPCWKWAAERGLMLGEHHMDNLGLNPFRWPPHIPYNYLSHPKYLEHAWKTSTRAKAAHGTKVVWSVGHRGKADCALWQEIPELKGRPDLQGKVLGDVIRRQIEIIKDVDPNPDCVLHTWMEISELLEKGHLTLPENVRLVWADFHGGTATVIEPGKPVLGEGVYYHLAMHGVEKGHLVAWAPLSRIRSEFLRYQQTGATYYVLINLSNVRPFFISASIATRWLYDGVGVKNDDTAIHDFFTQAMGLPSKESQDWYESLTSAAEAFGRAPDCLIGDEGPRYFSTMFLSAMLKSEGVSTLEAMETLRKTVLQPCELNSNRIHNVADLQEAVTKTCEKYAEVLRKAEVLVSGVEARFQQTAASGVLFPSRYMEAMWKMVDRILQAKIAQDAGNAPAAVGALEEALVFADLQHELLEEQSRGKWLGYYMCGVISPTRLPSQRIRWTIDVLRGFADAPAGHRLWCVAYRIFHEIKSYHRDRWEDVGV